MVRRSGYGPLRQARSAGCRCAPGICRTPRTLGRRGCRRPDRDANRRSTALPLLHRVGGSIPSPEPSTSSRCGTLQTEYPRIADRSPGTRTGSSTRPRSLFTAEPDHGEINKHHSATTSSHRLPAGHTCGEPVHVARSTTPRMTATSSRSPTIGWNDSSYLLVLDSATLEKLAEVHLPHRVPAGFHGTWLPSGPPVTSTR